MAKRGGEGQGPDFSSWVPAELIPGTRYELLEFIDEGGHARVYRVRHAVTGRVCAFKAIHRRHKTKFDLGARLKQEAALSTCFLGHPNIAEFLDAGDTDDGRPYCVVE